MSDAFLPPTGRQAWFQDGDDQVNLVGFYNVVSILTVVYISLAYFGSNSFLGIYSLFYYRHEFVGDATDIPFDTIADARLVLTDDLIRDALKKDKAARKARKKKGGAADEPSAGETDNED